jgi:hypothetical protein
MNRTRRRAIALLCAAALLSGCFSYVPATLGTIPVGQQVQVHLSPRAQVELSQSGTRVESAVKGTLAERRDNQILLKVPIATDREGFFRSDIERDLSVAETDIVGIELRQFSGSRTALAVGGAVGAGALIVITVIAASRIGSGPPGTGIEDLRIPLFSVPTR